jgi:hypothetical protein
MSTPGTLAVLAATLFVGMLVWLWPVRPNIARAQLTFSREGFHAVASRWSPEALRRVRSHFPMDYFFIALYVAAGWTFGQNATTHDPASIAHTLSTWVLPIAGIGDTIENLLHVRFLRAEMPPLPDGAYLVAGVAASVKFSAFAAFALLTVL